MLPQLPDRFELVRSLGEGGMGVVYEVLDRVRGEHVALKTLRHADADAIYRLKREFRALANLEHPNLVRLHDLFADGQTCFFTMELVQGVDLAAFVRSARIDTSAETIRDEDMLAFDEGLLRHALADLARGVGALHEAGLLHRDLKPSNVLVTRQGRVVVLDFGLVADAHAAVQQTKAGGVTGTVAYMAPEQARGESELTTAVDLYAIGAILFELLTLRLPYDGHPLRILAEKQTKDAPRPSSVSNAVPTDLDELCVALLARDPSARPSLSEVRRAFDGGTHASTRSSSSRSAGPVLLGRDEELARLDALFRRSHAGRPAVGLVRGRSGIGKSTLLSAFARRTERDGHAVVLAGRCHESETVPYKGLDGVIDALSRHLAMAKPEEIGRLLPPDLGDLATVFPVLRRIKPIASAYARRALVEREAPLVRMKGFACLRELLRRIAETSALVVVIDDVQWADADTARGLVELLRDEHAPSMLLLLGTRPTDASPVVQAIFGDEVDGSLRVLDRAELELGPLDSEALRSLAMRELGEGALSSMLEVIVRESAGSPFAAGELVRFIRDQDATVDSFGTTSSIDDLVRRRAESLDEPTRRVLDVLCVAGEPTAADVVLRSAGLPEEDRAPIDTLRVRHWIRTLRVGAATVVETSHDRMREAILDGLDDSNRRQLHRRLAAALEEVEPPPHDRLARHFAAAGDRALASHHAVAAAELASSALAFRRASELLGIAVENADPALRASLAPKYAASLAAAGRYEEAAREWMGAARTAGARDRREWMREAGECLLYSGRVDEGLEVLGRTAASLGAALPRTRVGFVFGLVRARLALALRGFRFRLIDPRAIRLEREERLRGLRVIAQWLSPLDPGPGTIVSSRYLSEALDAGSAEDLVYGLALEGGLRGAMMWLGATKAVEVALARLEATDVKPLAIVALLLVRAQAAGLSGRAASARRDAHEALTRLESLEPARRSSSVVWLEFLAHYVLGMANSLALSPADFARVARYASAREDEGGPYAALALRAGFDSHLAIRLGDFDAIHRMSAELKWEGASSRLLGFRVMAQVYAAWASLYAGEDEAMLGTIGEIRRSMIETGIWYATTARWLVLQIQACAACRAGRVDLARDAVRAFGGGRDEYRLGCRAWLSAVASLAEGDARSAVAHLELVRRVGASLGSSLFEGVACWGLGRLRPGDEGADARRRTLELLDGTGLVDPDRFFWSVLPIGEMPTRRGSTRAQWHDERSDEARADEHATRVAS